MYDMQNLFLFICDSHLWYIDINSIISIYCAKIGYCDSYRKCDELENDHYQMFVISG